MTRARTVPPTVKEMHDRSELLRARIGELGRTAANPQLQELGSELKRHGEALSVQVAAIEQTEADLIALTAEELFREA